MATELNRLTRLLEKSLREALESELRRIGVQDLRVKTEFPMARVRMRVPEGLLEMTGTIHGFLSDALTSHSDWELRSMHIRRGGGINPALSDRDTLRAVLVSLRHVLSTHERMDRSLKRHNPHILDASAVVRACLSAQAQLRWDGGDAGLRPLKASLKASFRTYKEHLVRCESDPSRKAMADHCTAKIRSLVPVIEKVDDAVRTAKRAERLNRKVREELEGSPPAP